MNKKITRRVVLGTAIAGLAAGPFVIKALRRKGDDLPTWGDGEGEFSVRPSDVRVRFFSEWKNLHQSMAVVQPTILGDGALSFPLTRDFSKPFQKNFRYMETHLMGDGKSDREIAPNDLVSYSILEGELRGGRAGANVVSVVALKNETTHLKIDVSRSRANGVGIIEKTVGGNATVVRVEVDVNQANIDQEKAEITTGIEEIIVAQKGEIGELTFDVDLNLTADTDLSNNLSFAQLYAKLYSLLYIPLPTVVVRVGSTVDFPVMSLLRQQSPHISYNVANAVSLRGFTAARVNPILAQDERTFRENVLGAARDAYHLEKDGEEVGLDESAFLAIVERRIAALSNEMRGSFASDNPHRDEIWFVDAATGLIICRQESFVRKYQKLGDCFVSRTFQVF